MSEAAFSIILETFFTKAANFLKRRIKAKQTPCVLHRDLLDEKTKCNN